ncbi:MAG: DegV family protein [Firmicutes bacterium]|nr:DegV family protein [Bacillota bacterium]
MKKWKIVADSSCDLRHDDIAAEHCDFTTVPFTMRIDGREFVDSEDLDTLTMVQAMEDCAEVSTTACPSPLLWAEEFADAEQVLAFTISAGLSGSYNSAALGREMALESSPDKQVAVLDSCSTGPAIAMCVAHVSQWIREGLPFDRVAGNAAELLAETKTIFALSSFDNLVKNGRVSKIAGFLAKNLGLWGVGIGRDGVIAMKGKARGVSRALNIIIQDMQERGCAGKEIIISHCHNLAVAEKLRERIQEHWAGAEITVLKTRGLDSFYAERGGLIVAYR